jgi:hypothetical protein
VGALINFRRGLSARPLAKGEKEGQHQSLKGALAPVAGTATHQQEEYY